MHECKIYINNTHMYILMHTKIKHINEYVHKYVQSVTPWTLCMYICIDIERCIHTYAYIYIPTYICTIYAYTKLNSLITPEKLWTYCLCIGVSLVHYFVSLHFHHCVVVAVVFVEFVLLFGCCLVHSVTLIQIFFCFAIT